MATTSRHALGDDRQQTHTEDIISLGMCTEDIELIVHGKGVEQKTANLFGPHGLYNPWPDGRGLYVP